RDCVRKFWKGDGNTVSEFATRLCGSSDLYEHNGRRPYASINFVTCHDGFALHDLVSYNNKHNEDNGQNNEDGEGHNNSWNCGFEGPSETPLIRTLRERQKRNFMATLMLSQGVAMIRSGDELSQTQLGNNNVYCQDTPLGWLDWRMTNEQADFLHFTKQCVKLWKSQPVLQRRQFFQGREIRGKEVRDVLWLTPQGREMTDFDWHAGYVRCLGMRLEGQMHDEIDDRGRHITGDTLLVLMNSHHEAIPFRLPDHEEDEFWQPLLDSAQQPLYRRLWSHDLYPLQGRSLAVLKLSHSWTRLFRGWWSSIWPGKSAEAKPESEPEESRLAARQMPQTV
ncbi:MAG: hypothetical protein Q8K78_15860, partial [Planctomycetaceae bacterium]|nr:hypothetical protein [Planctomycetaceae bacterium]